MLRYGLFAVGLCLFVTPAFSQSGTAPAASTSSSDQKALLQQQLKSQFKVTRMSADRSEVVTAGSVLVLGKDGLLMCSVDTKAAPTNTYKNGKISMGFGATFSWGMAAGIDLTQIPQRKFVAGEKFWVTDFAVQDDGLVFMFFSDPYQNVRYYGQLKFPFPKHVMPPADEMMKTVAEVLTVQPDENAGANPPQPQQGSGLAPPGPPGVAGQGLAPPSQQTLAPIAPPPPPPDAPPPQPKTISLGQTKEQVVAILGQPQKVVNLGTKEIDVYPDMKVTYVRGKVSDVQ